MKFFLRSLVQSVYSPQFYKEANNRPTRNAIGNLVLFSLLTGFIGALIFTVGNLTAIPGIKYLLISFPQIRLDETGLIINGLDMPYEISSKGKYIGIDTTGKLNEIPDQYSEGLLIRKNDFVLKDPERPNIETLKYSELFPDLKEKPFELDKYSAENYIKSFLIIISCISLIFSPLWSLIGKGIIVAVVALIGTAILSIQNKKDAFKTSLKISVYALIPITYIGLIWGWVSEIGSVVPILETLCCWIGLVLFIAKWVGFWALGYYGIYNQKEDTNIDITNNETINSL